MKKLLLFGATSGKTPAAQIWQPLKLFPETGAFSLRGERGNTSYHPR
jgi:hypothetical protein